MNRFTGLALLLLGSWSLLGQQPQGKEAKAPPPPMSFFVTSQPKGQCARVAQNVADLHGDTLEAARLGSNLTEATVFTEKNEAIKGFGDQPNQHDILTGSIPDGRAYTDGQDHTCNNWTSSGAGTAQLGHFDRTGGGNTSWNSTHASRGSSQENLVSTGGAGLLYCFAIDAPRP